MNISAQALMPTKECATCHTDKPISSYAVMRRNKDGRRSTCKQCRREGKGTDTDPAYVPPPRSYADSFASYGGRRAYRHRITDAEFDALWAEQNGLCGICSVELTLDTYTIDHDHTCPCNSKHGRLCGKCRRGLLCHRCNLGISHFADNAATIRKAANWVEDKRPIHLVAESFQDRQ